MSKWQVENKERAPIIKFFVIVLVAPHQQQEQRTIANTPKPQFQRHKTKKKRPEQ